MGYGFNVYSWVSVEISDSYYLLSTIFQSLIKVSLILIWKYRYKFKVFIYHKIYLFIINEQRNKWTSWASIELVPRLIWTHHCTGCHLIFGTTWTRFLGQKSIKNKKPNLFLRGFIFEIFDLRNVCLITIQFNDFHFVHYTKAETCNKKVIYIIANWNISV